MKECTSGECGGLVNQEILNVVEIGHCRRILRLLFTYFTILVEKKKIADDNP